MEFKQIKELMSAMERSNISRLSLKEKGFELELERNHVEINKDMERIGSFHPHFPNASSFGAFHSPVSNFPSQTSSEQMSNVSSVDERERPSEEGGLKVEDKETGSYVTSPMVGTFYDAPSPEASSFVKVGDVVDEDTVICIIEAMKVMNEVKAGVKGVIAEVKVEDGDPVEFGTKLFRISV